jgi:hypothetical protein
VNLFTNAATILAPAGFLFAEGAGCITGNSFRVCYSLLEVNFTVQLQLVLSYIYFLLFGFTLNHYTYDDIFNFTAPPSLICQLVGAFTASLLAFAVFGMRPRDVSEDDLSFNPESLYNIGEALREAKRRARMTLSAE